MLKLKNIKKDYVMKDQENVHALKGVNINFRRNEFVAILGPSGCGKTTLLNITGGLDRYTDGDLIIEGKSTKDFSDRDWDTYRNHSIGFVFQTYNLVSHLSLQGNVELALTIGGYKKAERIKRSRKALDNVGLSGLYKKRPNQLSGGQMQRVAIARALVTNPEIVLADEPTGALDSETSLQIMDLLKEVAHDRLVIMVTHNPDLAYKYADRIITMKDGEIITDSNPFEGEKISINKTKKESEVEVEALKPNKKAKMSLSTAVGLSFKNLISKFKRTALVCVAGSIGIIGVSAVLAVSNGVTSYIESMQDDMLSGNPVRIAKTALDLQNIADTLTTAQQAEAVTEATKDGYVNIDFLIKYLTEQQKNISNLTVNNTLNADYTNFVKSMPKEYYNAMELNYGIEFKNNFFTEVKMTPRNVAGDPMDLLKEETRMISLRSLEDMYSYISAQLAPEVYSMLNLLTNVFYTSPDNPEYILEQYDVVAGEGVADDVYEMSLVLSSDKTVTDLFLGQLGYYTENQFIALINYFANNEDASSFDDLLNNTDYLKKDISYEELVGKEFYYVPYSGNEDFMFPKNPLSGMINKDTETEINGVKGYYDMPYTYNYEIEKQDGQYQFPLNAKKVKIKSILQPKKNVMYGCLSAGYIISPKWQEEMLKDGVNSTIVKSLKESKDWYSSLTKDDKQYNNYAYWTTYTFECAYFKIENNTQIVPVTAKLLWPLVNISSISSGDSPLLSMLGINNSIFDSYETAIREFGGIDDVPSYLEIYPVNFDKKYLVTDYLDQWNNTKENVTFTDSDGSLKTLTPDDREKITYSDNLEVVINLIKILINVITIALLVFTSLSLIVSTVMIGIITYVSVVERVKEIGVIRSLGGRKMDVSNLFNAETFLIGLTSGVFGIFVTYMLALIFNGVIGTFSGIYTMINLPWTTSLIVIGVSILLTLISGLIPARAAARKDPVVALRTE